MEIYGSQNHIYCLKIATKRGGFGKNDSNPKAKYIFIIEKRQKRKTRDHRLPEDANVT